MWQSGTEPPNNSFKPNLLRYTNNMAGKACHVVGYATQVGLTQALALMDIVQPHPHNFPDSDWPFSDPVNALAISTTRVIRENYPILRVSHDYDGDWQVLCDTTVESRHGLVVCLGCCFQRDRTIGELADLPRGWTAWRDFVGGPWSREMKAPEDGDEA